MTILSSRNFAAIILIFVSGFSSSSRAHDFGNPSQDDDQEESPRACKKASAAQIAQVNAGNQRLNEFLLECSDKTGGSPWCSQLVRPNPQSIETFRCTYGPDQPHNLIHPDASTWSNAFQAVRLIDDLDTMGLKPCLIYNWWRPEPYNGNVGGVPGRHPYGTAVDVRFCSIDDMERAFTQLCKWKKAGRLRAVGYYGSTGLHFGIGDNLANTWGKSCPKDKDGE